MDETTTNTIDVLDERLITFGGAIKALGDGKVGGYLVKFTDADNPDLEGDFFTKDTDFDLEDGDRATVYYHHGLDKTLSNRKLGSGTVKNDEVGIWIEAQLALRDKYERAVYEMAKAQKVGWSSGTLPWLVKREPVAGAQFVKSWPIGKDATITPLPAAGPTITSVLTLKAYKQMAEDFPSLKALLPEDAQDSISASVTAGKPDANVSDSLEVEEIKSMSDTQAAPELTVDAIGEMLGAQLKSAFEPVNERLDKLEKAQPVDDDGGTNVNVVTDEADNALKGNPFKSFGEFLQTVATNGRDQRLKPIKSQTTGLNGYFNVTKAMGPQFVGSLSAMKAPLGLQEGIPSAGGFLVGTDRSSSLMARVYEVGNVLSRTDMVGIGANSNGMTFYAEDETSRATGSRRGGIRAYWAAEAEEKTKSKPKFREMELKLRKLVALCYATDELLADATALESWIMQAFPEEVNFVAEDSVFRGTGVGMPLGILNSGATVSIAKEVGQAAATIVAANIDKMWARRYIRGRNYAWFVNQDTSPQLANLNRPVGTAGDIVYSPPGGLSALPYATLKGAPVIETEYNSTLGTVGDIILADFGEYQMIDKGGIQSASSIHVQFVTDETVFRFVYRVDGQPKWDLPLTPFQGTNSVSPFITLATRA